MISCGDTALGLEMKSFLTNCGIRFHCGVDGYSRCIQWFVCLRNNRLPLIVQKVRVVLSFQDVRQLYLQAVAPDGKPPLLWEFLVYDLGTENTAAAKVHEKLRGSEYLRPSDSRRNQRAENIWRFAGCRFEEAFVVLLNRRQVHFGFSRRISDIGATGLPRIGEPNACVCSGFSQFHSLAGRVVLDVIYRHVIQGEATAWAAYWSKGERKPAT